MASPFYAIVCSKATGLYQTGNLIFDAVTQPTWTHVGGDLAIYQCAFNRLNPIALQVCISADRQTAYMRWPVGYGENWTQIMTAAQAKALIGDADEGDFDWIEYNAYMPGHVYIVWDYDITLGGTWFLRSTDYGVTWQAINLYGGITNYGCSCIAASRVSGPASIYANGGVIYLCIQYGIGATPYVMHSFDDGVTWATSNTTGTTAAAHLVYVQPRDDAVSYTDMTFGAGNNDLGRNDVYGVGNYNEIDGATQAGIPAEAAMWINPRDRNMLRVARNQRIYYSNDYGATWNNSPAWAIGEVRAMDGMESTPNLLLGKYAVGAPNLVWLTMDDGTTLINKSGANAVLPDGGGDSVPFTSGIAPQGVAIASYAMVLGGILNMTTPTMSEFFDEDMGTIWVQPDGANTQCYPLLCHSTDGFTEPMGDVTTRMCRGTKGWAVSHRGQGVPNDATIDIEAYLTKTQMWLQKQAARRCEMPVYLHLSQCGDAGLFLNYDTGELGRNTIITNKTPAATVRGKADGGDGAAAPTTATWSLVAEPITNKYWNLVETIRAVAEAEPLRDVVFCNAARCLSPCGTAEYECEDGVITADATGAVTADTWGTTDGWATSTVMTVPPFAPAAACNVASTTCFYIDRDTVRIMVMRGTTVADATPIAYSDDTGVTWTQPAASGTANSYAPHGGCLYSLDKDHIWHCSDLGTIWFSGDGGLTWTDQDAPVPGGGVQDLYCIHFRDANYGAAVGESGTFMYTSDGGGHWTIGTAPVAGTLTGVSVIDANRVWCVSAAGVCYYSNDMGTTWNTRTLPTTPTALGDIAFADEFMGAICGNYHATDDYGIVYRTFNGGHDWEVFINNTAFDTTLEYYGLNALWICDWNHIYAVGEPVDSVGLIFELSNAGPA
jgi:photosystem II stability/assembly factor-like uncharacterized protein